MEHFDVIVLGAGAAGMMCAMTAGARGRRVLLLDHASEAGAKILISGGGRCNFTNLATAPDRFFSRNPRFCTSALSRYKPQDFVALIQRHGIAYHEKTLGQLFCDGSARSVVAMLLAECSAAGVVLRLRQRIRDVVRADRFRVETDGGDIFADAVVLATGGLSIPKMGATGIAYDITRRFGLAHVECRPALVPLTLAPEDLVRTNGLSGVSLPVVASCRRSAFREALLFTHRGLSGPAILQISSCWREGDAVAIDMLPDAAPATLCQRKRARPKSGLRAVLSELLPQRLADMVLSQHSAKLTASAVGDTPDRALLDLEHALKTWRVAPSGSEGYAKAEVTLGGIDTGCLSQRTMAALDVPGLFVVGEAVDVTGWLGGYNFQWAWASGRAAGEVA